jgi:hypothetical protein
MEAPATARAEQACRRREGAVVIGSIPEPLQFPQNAPSDERLSKIVRGRSGWDERHVLMPEALSVLR